jgi:hypothetical protein
MRTKLGPLGLVCLERRPALDLGELKPALGAQAREGRASQGKGHTDGRPPAASRKPGMNRQASGENVAGQR